MRDPASWEAAGSICGTLPPPASGMASAPPDLSVGARTEPEYPRHAQGSRRCAQAVHQQVVGQDRRLPGLQFADIPGGAEIAAPGPIRPARAQPDGKASGQRGLIDQIAMHRLGHAAPQLGRHPARVQGKALDPVFAMIDLHELAQPVHGLFRGLIVRRPRHHQLRADGRLQDQVAAAFSSGCISLRGLDQR